MKRSFLGRLCSRTYTAVVFLFLYLPIAVSIVLSFNNSRSRNAWAGFSLRWYESLFQNDTLMKALLNTLVIAFLSAAIATLIGTFAAIGIYYMKKGFLKSTLMNLSYLPMLNPDIVTGVSLLILFTAVGVTLGFQSLLIAHIAFNIPYVILSVMPKLKQMNESMYEAALDLGMRPMNAIFKVILPEVRPGITSGFLLALTLSIDDFVISFFTTGPGVSTLSIEIYSMARRGVNPEINALSAIMFVAVFIILLISNFAPGLRKSEKKERRI
ncbi:ABC transporter permease [Feifania hominis]|uniref:ABC transporter permease n=1 Tax=Feifania hominis TaxID=2763660 RepID=A0A926HTP2_9FIRM|nr:ABC transporter permease [Feifania hominis]MBC8535503.1 ABC transporter permease [Feifania hominis]